MSKKSNKKNEEEINSTSSSKVNPFEKKDAVIKEITNSVVASFKDNLDRKNCKNKRYVLWIDTTNTVFDGLSNQNFYDLTLKEVLIDGLAKKGFEIDSLEIRLGKPDGDLLHYTKITALDITMYLDIVTAPTSTTSSEVVLKARITLAPGSSGALKQPDGYEIDSEHAPYNIGRVPVGDLNRVNHIEIVDETCQVSRIHAHIGFASNVFFLQRDKKTGQKPNEKITNRTTITRNNGVEELKSLSSKMILKDGDIICLSDRVSLLFNILK